MLGVIIFFTFLGVVFRGVAYFIATDVFGRSALDSLMVKRTVFGYTIYKTHGPYTPSRIYTALTKAGAKRMIKRLTASPDHKVTDSVPATEFLES